jgi:hypothetical protein
LETSFEGHPSSGEAKKKSVHGREENLDRNSEATSGTIQYFGLVSVFKEARRNFPFLPL